ncbi:MAG: hypothetical protein GTO55_07910, partial [Armatimonadetes bacterium]|nr:hypothetical protein [Armatimonadota bacterium]NIM24183.1 hypothetical protein [Armatimonadota bacterium]NIM68048.1 hypothetical protein [Armatimonadota bacterium]NIM76082.1 hypothetical protein [Armatimonadota bacterium]NIN05753.1 hypothetical protein [Armatimonadota bacterium]
GYEEIAVYIREHADEWNKRNGHMADNIARIASQFPGKRIVVITGAEHRYILRDLLSEKPNIVLKEFWEAQAE